jgi:hypothetical protein
MDKISIEKSQIWSKKLVGQVIDCAGHAWSFVGHLKTFNLTDIYNKFYKIYQEPKNNGCSMYLKIWEIFYQNF